MTLPDAPPRALGILENNIRAQQFWTALGYQEIDRQPDLAKDAVH